MSLKVHGNVSVVDAKIQISSPAFFFPTTDGGPGQSWARARAASQASYPGLTRNLNRHLKTGSGRRAPAARSSELNNINWPARTLMAQDEILSQSIETIMALPGNHHYLSPADHQL